MAVQYPAKEVAKALRETYGIVTAAARKLGCDRSTVHRKIRKYKTVREARDEGRDQAVDIGEGRLMSIVNDPTHKDHFKAVRMLLRTQGKDRGYSERHEVTGKDGEPVRHSFEWADPDDAED